MTRLELIQLLVGQARKNGFQFKKWYTRTFELPWQSSQHACELLANERRYYVLLFSHEFACNFWKPGEEMTFLIQKQTFQRKGKDGIVRVVERKPYTRRSVRPDAWRYHLKELALADEPLRYMRRYLKIAEDLDAAEDRPNGRSTSRSGPVAQR